MASFSEKVKWVKKPTYADVRELYEQVQEISTQMNCTRFDPFFHFTCGSMRCTTHSVEEFIQAAYGADDFHLVAMQLIIFLNGDNKVSAGYLGDLSVSGSNKMLLEDFKNRLHLNVFEDNGERQLTVMNNNNAHAHSSEETNQGAVNSPITINGSGNIINVAGGSISGNSDIKLQEEKKDEKKDFVQKHPFISAIVASVLAGIILLFNCWETFVEFIETVIGCFVP